MVRDEYKTFPYTGNPFFVKLHRILKGILAGEYLLPNAIIAKMIEHSWQKTETTRSGEAYILFEYGEENSTIGGTLIWKHEPATGKTSTTVDKYNEKLLHRKWNRAVEERASKEAAHKVWPYRNDPLLQRIHREAQAFMLREFKELSSVEINEITGSAPSQYRPAPNSGGLITATMVSEVENYALKCVMTWHRDPLTEELEFDPTRFVNLLARKRNSFGMPRTNNEPAPTTKFNTSFMDQLDKLDSK